jgi:hypothetical protein
MAYSFSPIPSWQLSDGNGKPYAGGLIYTYESGTTTPKTTYNENGVANTNPVVLDSEGRATIKLDVGRYRMILTDGEGATIFDPATVEGTTIWSIDNVGDDLQAVSTVATIAELKSIPIATIDAGSAVFVQSPAGVFLWDEANSESSDNGVVIAPNDVVNLGRWVRMFDGGVNPRWWGAAGDSLTDDTAAFISAKDYANSHNCQIVLDYGVFYLATDPGLLVTEPQVVMNAAAIKWSGYALNINPLIPVSDVNRHFYYTVGADNPIFPASSEIKNIWLDGTTAGWLQHTLALQSDMATAQSDIDTLQSQMSTAQSDIDTAQSDIGTLQSQMGSVYPIFSGSFVATFPTNKNLTVNYEVYSNLTKKIWFGDLQGLDLTVTHTSGSTVPAVLNPAYGYGAFIPTIIFGGTTSYAGTIEIDSGIMRIYETTKSTNTNNIASAVLWYR